MVFGNDLSIDAPVQTLYWLYEYQRVSIYVNRHIWEKTLLLLFEIPSYNPSMKPSAACDVNVITARYVLES